ncbi:MAG: PepSY domain-containing protein [Alteromonadaceae bacterium]|nr:PepSY domain-containing protein [Alteromonadaceae bacterium]
MGFGKSKHWKGDQIFDASKANLVTRIWNFKYKFHIGEFFGTGVKFIWLLLALLPAGFAVSGLWLYYKRPSRLNPQILKPQILNPRISNLHILNIPQITYLKLKYYLYCWRKTEEVVIKILLLIDIPHQQRTFLFNALLL